ncbi:MAG: uroporphyrinogen decarboxylase [Eubacteriaceae bacterium]|nr:uroporphyrinogen decarboxylase [Eubacteriaceae bacterium]
MQAKELAAYRRKLLVDLYSGIVPDRIPVSNALSLELFIEYAGKDLMLTQYNYNYEELIEIFEKAMEINVGDDFNAAFARNAVAGLITKNTFSVMSSSGFIQHPENSIMNADEYDQLIADPEAFIGEVVIPRMSPLYSQSPTMFAVAFLRAFLSNMDQNMALGRASSEIGAKYGYPAPTAPMSMSGVPFDELADSLRGFRNVTIDIKRQPQKVLDAMEALMPKNIASADLPYVDITQSSAIMTHMGVFLNTKDFERFYWPDFAKLCHIAGERNTHMFIFCEGDWTRFYDHLYDLPAGCRFMFEYGDAKAIKDKLGKKHIVGGLYPVTYLKSKTKQECIDKAKEIIDIMAPGGNYQFQFDKQALSLSDINVENYVAVLNYVIDNGKYANAGQKASGEFDFTNFQGTVKPYLKDYPPFKSKFDLPFEEFIKGFPVPAEKALPLMKMQYEKYLRAMPYPTGTYGI